VHGAFTVLTTAMVGLGDSSLYTALSQPSEVWGLHSVHFGAYSVTVNRLPFSELLPHLTHNIRLSSLRTVGSFLLIFAFSALPAFCSCDYHWTAQPNFAKCSVVSHIWKLM